MTSVRPAAAALIKAVVPAALVGCGLALPAAYADDGAFSSYINHYEWLDFAPTAKATYFVSDSVFKDITQEQGGAIRIRTDASTTLTIRDSEFKYNQSTKQPGGAISIQSGDDNVVLTLNIIAENKDVLFENNIGGSEYTQHENDIYALNTTLNLFAAEGKKISFDGEVEVSSRNDLNAVLNINESGQTYSYTASVANEIKTAEAATGGEVIFKSSVGGEPELDINLYGGTVTLLNPSVWYGSLVNFNIATAFLTVNGEATLRGREASPVKASDYTVSQKADAYAAAADLEKTELQSIILSRKLKLNSNLMIQPAVDLSAATEANNGTGLTDTYTAIHPETNHASYPVTGTGKLVVSGWIIKAEGELTSVTVDLASDDSLKDYFSLGDSGTVAVGPVHVWTVAQDGDKSSQFTFTMVNAEDEDQYFKPDPVSGEEGNEEDSEDEKEEDKGQTGSNSSDTPFNYNPDVYGGAVAALGTSVIQHALTEAVFADAGLRGKAAPERKQWWGTVRGADLNLKTKNFYGTEYDYALAVVGHNFEPFATAAGSVEFGAYLGAATGSAKYSNNKVRQNGGFAGASAVLKNGAAFAGVQTTFGVMNNRLRGYSDNSFTTHWFGAGATAGFALDVPAADLTVTPRINLSYVRVTGRSYTTSLDAKVENAALHSFETSPAVRLDKRFTAGWSAFGEARYAFVSKNGGRSTASYGSGVSALPSIAGKNYAEYGLGVRKDAKNAGISLNVSRADGGRSGWAGTLRADYRF
jgi:outer membrane autotransporter protein